MNYNIKIKVTCEFKIRDILRWLVMERGSKIVNFFGQITVWNLHLLAKNYNFGNFVQPRIDVIHKRFVIIYFLSFMIRDYDNYGHNPLNLGNDRELSVNKPISSLDVSLGSP